MSVAKTNTLISCTVICAFVFSYAKSRFSHDELIRNSLFNCECQLHLQQCAIRNYVSNRFLASLHEL